MTIHKILKYLALVLGVIGLILLARIIMAGDDAISNSVSTQASVLDPMMWLSYLVLIVVIAMVLFFVLKGLFSGNIKNTLISVGAFLLVIVIAYVITGGDEVVLKDGEIISASASHWISTGLVVFYILASVAVLAMVLSGVRKLVK